MIANTTYLRNAASSLTLPQRRAQLVAAIGQAEGRIKDGQRDLAAAKYWLREFDAECADASRARDLTDGEGAC